MEAIIEEITQNWKKLYCEWQKGRFEKEDKQLRKELNKFKLRN